MGVYLSTPNTEKSSCDETCKNFTYGASSMQGWRMTQEDAHNCLPDYEENSALFAVYDGHGGAEVAQYCAANLPPFLKESRLYKEGKYVEALEEAYLGFDALLTTPEVIKELKVLAGVESDDEHEDDKAQSLKQKKSEAEMLRQEADMPIDELMAKYEYGETPQQPRTRLLRKKGHATNSPVIKPKKMSFPSDAGEESTDANINANVDAKLEEKISNGHAENENNLNLEKESQMSSVSPSLSSSVQQDTVSSSADGSSASSLPSSSKEKSLTADTSNNQADSSVSSNTLPGSSQAGSSKGTSSSSHCGGSGSSKSESDQVGSTESGEASSSNEAKKTGSSSTGGGASSSSSSEAACGSSSDVVGGSGTPQGGSSSSTAGESSSKSDEPATSSGGSAGGEKGDEEEEEDDDSEEDIEEMMGSGDEDEDDDYEGAGSDDEDEDEDEEESEDTDEEETCTPAMNEMTEEPGSDSGTTAVVALIKDKQIFVANAGDSRCILCRGGKALDLSADHKPEDIIEKNRIEAAGGKVTEEGRVNGGLNMSRAIGDHFYKRNIEKSAKEQMITALPDIETATLRENDEFLVLACDGIWNYMTSQEVVDFVREKMKEEDNRKKLSLICEMLFDTCLAPNTLGDGTGCDNMTCIIVTFDQIWNNNKNKRLAENSEESVEKRRRMDDT